MLQFVLSVPGASDADFSSMRSVVYDSSDADFSSMRSVVYDSIVDGWFRTGCAGYLRDGYLSIHDRVKDMIVSGGENIYPAEIENALMKHEGIADVAVIGVPSEQWGKSVRAMIVRADPGLTDDDVIEYARTQLAGYKIPRSVDWVDALPRNPSGKVLKVELRQPFWEGRDRQVD